jgi:hypothetical protein
LMESVLVGDVVSKLNVWSRGVGKAGKVLIRKPDADIIRFCLDQLSDSP